MLLSIAAEPLSSPSFMSAVALRDHAHQQIVQPTVSQFAEQAAADAVVLDFLQIVEDD